MVVFLQHNLLIFGILATRYLIDLYNIFNEKLGGFLREVFPGTKGTQSIEIYSMFPYSRIIFNMFGF